MVLLQRSLEPGESTSSLFKSVTLDCNANLAAEKVCYDTPTGTVCEEPDDDDAYDKYHLVVTVQTSDEDFPREDEHYTVTIDPNGGEYNGSTDVYSASLNYGTVIDLSQAVYVGHDLEYWTFNETDTYTESSITVEDNISLKANWISSTWHTITVDPNGGNFEGHTTSYETSVREGTNFTLSDAEPTKDNFLFDGWTINGVALTNYTFPVNEDLTILANWSPIIAQNNRTNKFYRSITAAEAEAVSGDTISLVADAEEEFTNTKNITLNLNALRLNGSITNNGTLTLLNGEVNSDAGAAVTNNGTLTMGINDYKDDGTVDIQPNYIRLIGTDTGLKQNGEFNFYDGFIEGDIALDGGYNDSPFYRKTFDDEIVHFFPFIDKNQEKDCQHAALESSDLAVSKTAVNGDIYYYSVQDNINTSIRTGYKIYIVREGFSTGEPLTVPENTDITIDIDGHTFTATDTITVNGKSTIEDSKSTINSETGEVEYAGNIQTPQTTIINGELVMKNSRMTGTTINDAIQNNATLTMRGGRIGATTGYVMQPKTGATLDLDEKSSLYSTSTNKATIYNSLNNFIWSSTSKIKSNYVGIQNASDSSTVTMNNGTIEANQYGITGGTVVLNSGSIIVNNTGNRPSAGINATTATMNGGSISLTSNASGGTDCTKTSNYCASGINASSLTIEDGSIYAEGPGTNTSGASGTLTINGGTITVVGTNNHTNGTRGNNTINGGTITATTTGSGRAAGVVGYNGARTKITGGTITSTATGSGSSYAALQNTNDCYVGCGGSPITINGGNLSAHSETGVASGVYISHRVISTTITNGSISSDSTSGTSYGVYSYGATITGGNISGKSYGIYANNSAVTIGNDDETVNIDTPEITSEGIALHEGSYSFYDGILRGGAKAYSEGVIKTIADGFAVHFDSQTIGEISYAVAYLSTEEYVARIGEAKYTKLSDAIGASEENDIIELIADNHLFYAFNIPAEKSFTLKTNGFKIIVSTPITNNGKMSIINNSTSSNPVFGHQENEYYITNNAGAELALSNIAINSPNGINNKGLLNLDNTSITSSQTAINNTGRLVASNNQTIVGTSYALYNDGGTISLSDGDITGKIYNNSGETELINSSASQSGNSVLDFITNNGTMKLNAFEATFATEYTSSSSTTLYPRTLYNAGTLIASNNSSIKHVGGSSDTTYRQNIVALYNDGGNVQTSNTTYEANGITAKSRSTSRYAYGIYNPAGEIEITSGTVLARDIVSSYGIWNGSGSIIIGTPEPIDSPNYGGDNADVSTTEPAITATAKNSSYSGIGVKNASGGRVEYYDGKISGNTAAFAEEPTVTEHFYEVCTELDTSVTPNLYTARLFWMRDGQSTCANN